MRNSCRFTLVVAALSLLTGSALAQEPPPAVPAEPVEPATPPTTLAVPPDASKLQPEEIALWGQVVAFDAFTGELKLQAKGFELPNGRRATFAHFKDKAVRLATDAKLVGKDQTPLLRDEVKNGHWVFVIGLDEGAGTTLSARFLRDDGENEPSISAPVLPENPPPSIEPTPTPVTPKPTPTPMKPTLTPTPALTPVKPKPTPTPRKPTSPTLLLPSPPATALMTLADISPWLRQAAAAFPDQVQILPLTVTAGGRAVLALQIAPPDVPLRQLRRLVVICRQHGDEPETTAAGVEFIRQMLVSRTARALRLRRQVAVLIVPVANPDGAWRKRRHNGIGQDLNRDWGRGRSREVGALMELLAAWQPHLVVDVHQWVPGDNVQTPMAEASGGSLGRRAAAGMTLAARAGGFRLAYRTYGTGGTLCHRYWGGQGVPGILLETIHRPQSPRSRQIAIATSVLALQRALNQLAG